jgi:hypothetical protein
MVATRESLVPTIGRPRAKPIYLSRSDRHPRRVPARQRNSLVANKKGAHEGRLSCLSGKAQISRITGIINGRRLVLFWMYRFRSLRIFSLITP